MLKDLKTRPNFKRVVALLLVVAFACLIALTNAKFLSTFGLKSPQARVSFFLGDQELIQPINGEELAPGESKTDIDILLSNRQDFKKTEVSMTYTIKVNNYGSLPLTYQLFEVAADGAKTEITDFKDNLNHSEKLGPGNIAEANVNYCLRIHWPEEYNQLKYSNDLEVSRLTIQAEQMD
ncbi:hypothetical protein [Enterococcus alishanensis]